MRMRRWATPAPLFIESTTQVKVRFQEVDVLRVVWHGHYLSYFEVGRTEFGDEYGLRYQDFLEAGYVVPLVHVGVDYLAPARYGEELTVVTRLHLEGSARVQFTYETRDKSGKCLARGRTVQAFMDLEGHLVLTAPGFYSEFVDGWREKLAKP